MTKIWAEFCSWILQFGEGVAQLLGVAGGISCWHFPCALPLVALSAGRFMPHPWTAPDVHGGKGPGLKTERAQPLGASEYWVLANWA